MSDLSSLRRGSNRSNSTIIFGDTADSILLESIILHRPNPCNPPLTSHEGLPIHHYLTRSSNNTNARVEERQTSHQNGQRISRSIEKHLPSCFEVWRSGCNMPFVVKLWNKIFVSCELNGSMPVWGSLVWVTPGLLLGWRIWWLLNPVAIETFWLQFEKGSGCSHRMNTSLLLKFAPNFRPRHTSPWQFP